MSLSKRLLIFIGLATCIIGADQITKALIVSSAPLHSGYEVIPGFLDMVHVRNPGAAFGIFARSDSQVTSLFFVGLSLVALAAILYLIFTSRDDDLLTLLGLTLFFAGATGNLIDRIRFREVIDFLYFHVGPYYWPAFNVADASLCVGAGLFFVSFLRTRGATPSNTDAPANE